MQIREAKASDIPTIVNLLKVSLGESLIPKSQALWEWKHLQSPFGVSPVWVAEDNDKLIGVRAYMPWEWTKDEIQLKALRAVDTAVHPHYQGKGLFKKLSLGLMEDSSKKGFSFVFNTPNQKSLPGYLKMGWQKKGKLPLRIAIVRPIHLLMGILTKSVQPIDLTPMDWSRLKAIPLEDIKKSNFLTTRTSLEFLQWRYAQNPLFNYGYISDEKSYLCIFRIKSYPWSNELRITELYPLKKESLINQKHLQSQLKKLLAEFPIDFISYSAGSAVPIRSFGKVRFFKAKIGPLLTLRNMTLEEKEFNDFFKEEAFSMSLGDLELF
ncbi:GNAT family N-acetyltransferase [Echinicola sp. CAU 1574]|uniref:GNAT family N-acetyltransferase n=1 Tax=Echinicola arenosa TaxID=2774144 RepID=A0ABR9ANT5_9BACT|nr:GNAT family N-acetyltransferase [Echinicola arenosa]MBD8490451.1 GNAT family N-acetyltransferase [Echinicola arenosa]